jgi:tRNA G37 N-methylase TrmD
MVAATPFTSGGEVSVTTVMDIVRRVPGVLSEPAAAKAASAFTALDADHRPQQFSDKAMSV